MGEGEAASVSRPTITLPPRGTFENWFAGGAAGESPGPLSLVSSFFSDSYADSKCRTFTQLLAGAMASPVAVAAGLSPSFFMGRSPEEGGLGENGDGGDENSGFKQKRPSSVAVARAPIFMVPPGLSPSGLLNSPGYFSPVKSPFGMSHQQALVQVTAHAVLSQSHMCIQTDCQPSSEPLKNVPSLFLNIDQLSQTPLMVPAFNKDSITDSSDISHSDKRSQLSSADKPADDGYNWRKYGQKHVKGSEYPRSYYKCTHLNCPVRKKVERSLNGQIIEIIYKGQHNHELPQFNRPARDGADRSVLSQGTSQLAAVSNESTHSDSVLRSDQPGQGVSDDAGDSESAQMGVDDESNPRKGSVEAIKSEPIWSQKTVTESRFIFQTRSEVNLLDDGYRWRKYGQKVVKGNHHPRSYYKCTSQGCNVRKHVERAFADPSAVITTYEGKHNHDIPALRLANHSRPKLHDLVDDKPASKRQATEN